MIYTSEICSCRDVSSRGASLRVYRMSETPRNGLPRCEESVEVVGYTAAGDALPHTSSLQSKQGALLQFRLCPPIVRRSRQARTKLNEKLVRATKDLFEYHRTHDIALLKRADDQAIDVNRTDEVTCVRAKPPTSSALGMQVVVLVHLCTMHGSVA